MIEKPKKRKVAHVVPMRTHESPSPGTTETSPEETDGDIARRAFELYCERGCHDGHDVEDWLQAARDLRPAGLPQRLDGDGGERWP